MYGYRATFEWRGTLDPDSTGTEEVEFLAYNDEHARDKAHKIAEKERFEIIKLEKATENGLAPIEL